MGVLFVALGVAFIAELGDKSMLVALGLGAKYQLRLVLTGVAVAFAFTNAFAVVIGGLFGAAFPERIVAVVAGSLFVLFALRGAWQLRSADDEGSQAVAEGFENVDVQTKTKSERPTVAARVIASIALTIFVAELGDKTMISTAALAAKGSVVWVWAGATLGEFASSAAGVLVGRAIGKRISQRTIEIASVIVFAAVGVAILLSARAL
jgi:Ca2+/H+ antiporter, TMEM165/GDT1 family